MHKMVVLYNSNVCENSLVQWNVWIHWLPRDNAITMSPVLVGRNFSSVDILLTFTFSQCNVMTLLNNLSETGAWCQNWCQKLHWCNWSQHYSFTPTRETHRGPAGIPPESSAVHGLVCRNCVVLFTLPAGPLRGSSIRIAHRAILLRALHPALNWQFGSADWAVFIDQLPSAAKWGLCKLKPCMDPCQCKHLTHAKKRSCTCVLRVGVNTPLIHMAVKQARSTRTFVHVWSTLW